MMRSRRFADRLWKMAYRKAIDVTLTADACIFWALALLVLPLKWIIGTLLAAAFHECCHYLALRLCRVRVYGLRIGSAGALMETEAMGQAQELFCALAGPAGSFLLVVMLRWFPELAVCAGIQGLYNLLPIFPLDGGRAVRSILGMLGLDKLAEYIQWATIAAAVIMGAAAYIRLHLGFGVLVVTFLLVHRALPRNIPCKAGRKRVQ